MQSSRTEGILENIWTIESTEGRPIFLTHASQVLITTHIDPEEEGRKKGKDTKQLHTLANTL